MLAKPINSALKTHFKQIFLKANSDAEKQYNENIKSRLSVLDKFNQFNLITKELNILDVSIEKNEYPFYIQNHSSEEWLLNQFASRTFLLNVNEYDQLYESIHLGKYRSLLSQEKFNLMESIPEYCYSDFLSGIVDPYFFNFYRINNISEEDYYKIRKWQASNLLKVVSYASNIAIKKIQTHCKKLSDPLKFILSENEFFENTILKSNPDPINIKSALKELFIFKSFDIDAFNDSVLVNSFNNFQSEEINWSLVTPTFINPLLEKVKNKSSVFFCNEASVFFTLNQISHWFDDVLKGLPVQQYVKEINYERIFYKVKEDALVKAEAFNQKIDDYTNSPDASADEIKAYLIENLEFYRRAFNDFDNKYYFGCLDDGKEDVLKSMFITNSFLGHDFEKQSKIMSEAIIIHEALWNIVCIYSDIFNTRKIEYPGGNSQFLEVMYLMNQMVLDKELYNELQSCIDDFMEHFQTCFLPIEIYFRNHRVIMADLFQKSLSRLQNILDDSESSNKILYLQSRLKQLRQRELEFKQIQELKSSNDDENRYSILFKEFLEIEADFIRETIHVQITPELSGNTTLDKLLLPSTDIISTKKVNEVAPASSLIISAYKYKKYEHNLSAITDLLDNLKSHNFVSKNTELTEFRKIFRDTRPTNPIIWSGNISELFYFIKLLHNDFELIDKIPKNIWKITDSLFVDENGKPFGWHRFRKQTKPANSDLLEKAAGFLK